MRRNLYRHLTVNSHYFYVPFVSCSILSLFCFFVVVVFVFGAACVGEISFLINRQYCE